MTVEPTKITNFERTDSEIQAFALFVGFVAGKNADNTVKVIERLLNQNKNKTPFEYLSSLGENGIRNALVAAKAGQYSRG